MGCIAKGGGDKCLITPTPFVLRRKWAKNGNVSDTFGYGGWFFVELWRASPVPLFNQPSNFGTIYRTEEFMNSRERVLNYLATDYRVAGLTAGEALASITADMSSHLSQKDQHFFRLHADEPCHEATRACHAGHVWHGNENKV